MGRRKSHETGTATVESHMYILQNRYISEYIVEPARLYLTCLYLGTVVITTVQYTPFVKNST